ncbi:hypothetical protein Tco_1413417, partial [Tanacetum coccineum]
LNGMYAQVDYHMGALHEKLSTLVNLLRQRATRKRFWIYPCNLTMHARPKTKDDIRKAYAKCNDIPQESRALIDTFLKERSDKDYELNLSMYGKTTKIEKHMNAKLGWLRKKYNYRSQTHIGGSSSQTHEIGDVYLTEKELHQLHLDEEALRETLEEEARDEKEREEKIRQKQSDDEEFMLEFGVKYDSEYESD